MYKEITSVAIAFKKHPGKLKMSLLKVLDSIPAKFSKGMKALFILQVITEVVNNDDSKVPKWEADYNNNNQQKWFPWYIGGAPGSGSGFRFYISDYDWAYASAAGGARLALKDESRAEHMNKHFMELYRDLQIIME